MGQENLEKRSTKAVLSQQEIADLKACTDMSKKELAYQTVFRLSAADQELHPEKYNVRYQGI